MERFYPNFGLGHPANAQRIVDENPKLRSYYEKVSKEDHRYEDYEEFLLYKMDFAKYGMSGDACVIIRRTSPYKQKLKGILRHLGLEVPDDDKIYEWS
jgi:hypothetical protein